MGLMGTVQAKGSLWQGSSQQGQPKASGCLRWPNAPPRRTVFYCTPSWSFPSPGVGGGRSQAGRCESSLQSAAWSGCVS